jgi:hypothetical protein
MTDETLVRGNGGATGVQISSPSAPSRGGGNRGRFTSTHQPERKGGAALPRVSRSSITNGTRLLPSVHPQSVWGRLMRDIMDGMEAHLGGNVSETQRMACRRIAVLEVELIYQEDALGRMRCEGKVPTPEQLDLYARLGNAQRRFLEHMGWSPIPKDIVPSLASYVAATNSTGENNDG